MTKGIFLIGASMMGLAMPAVAQQGDSTRIVIPSQQDVITEGEGNDIRSDDAVPLKDEVAEDETDKASQAGRTISAQLKDERLESKEGPGGEPVFVNAEGQYYYINKRGAKVIVDKSELKVKN
jgi:hypothetical protein